VRGWPFPLNSPLVDKSRGVIETPSISAVDNKKKKDTDAKAIEAQS